MAQPIRPEVWMEGIDDNRLLPSRYTNGLFIGSGVKIANNNEACRVYDMQISDYITDYDDRRLNGLTGTNSEGRDGWGASAYGTFQDVRFDSRVYTMGRHRSTAMRVFKNEQYSGSIGTFGTASASNVITNGEGLMNTASIISKAMDLWKAEVLGPDIDKYTLSAICQGHISGRWVDADQTSIFNGEGTWIAQPGMVQGQPIAPRFAPIHCIEWDDINIPLMLQNIKVTWNNLFIPQDNRVILIDPFYEYRLLSALTGKGVPATSEAYADLREGSFTRLMGWDFDFQIPTQYWPKLYVDDNLNVVHTADGQAAYDSVINSISASEVSNPDLILQTQLAAADRMARPNFIRTTFNSSTGLFEKTVTNYPLGQPGAVPYLGEGVAVTGNYGLPATYPYSAPGSGYGLSSPTGPVVAAGSAIRRRQVIGMALYKKAAQVSQEYSSMLTADGGTRGQFTEVVMDVKFDAWVIEGLSHGILPIIDAKENVGAFAIPTYTVTAPVTTASITSVTVSPDTWAPKANATGAALTKAVTVTVVGAGPYDPGWSATVHSDTNSIIDSIGADGTVKLKAANLVAERTATVRFKSWDDATKYDDLVITVAAAT